MKPVRPRAFVTGGGSGIGLAVARAFRDAGTDVTVAGRDEAKLRDTGLPYAVIDVSDRAAIEAGVKQAGTVDIFVANAGGAESAPALKMRRDVWDRIIALNLTSVFDCAQVVIPGMVERGWGRFIVMGSTASLRGYRYVCAYAAAKHGVLGLMRTLALELATTGVTANALCPGYVDTPLVTGAIDGIVKKTGRSRDEATAEIVKTNPMGRMVTPEEVAAAAVWLASDGAASVNGQAIPIDGGSTA